MSDAVDRTEIYLFVWWHPQIPYNGQTAAVYRAGFQSTISSKPGPVHFRIAHSASPLPLGAARQTHAVLIKDLPQEVVE
jgi:hypothetical protein